MRYMGVILKWISVSLLSLLLASFILGALFIVFHYSDIFSASNVTASNIDVSHEQEREEITAANVEYSYPGIQGINCLTLNWYKRIHPDLPLTPELQEISDSVACEKEKSDDTIAQNNKKDAENGLRVIVIDFFIKEFEESEWPILIIYILLTLILSVPFHPYIYKCCRFNPDFKLPPNYEEFLINAPPMLGVLGTIFSLAYFMQQSEGDISNISDLLRGGFYDASLTTIIGGIVYLINLFLISTMQKNNG